MTTNLLKTAFFILTLVLSLDCFSQVPKKFFSVTGDTVCYISNFGQTYDSIHISHTAYIERSENSKTKTISSFQIICNASNTCLESLNKDTLQKYHLQFDGIDANLKTNKDFIITVIPTNTHVVDTSAFGPKFIYQTTLSVDLSCKGKKLYSKTFIVMYKGNSPNDFPQGDFVRINAWRKKQTNKYLIDLSVKEHQTLKKPGDTPSYDFANFIFIL